MKMNAHSTEQTDVAKTTTRRYSRGELFRLAKLMPNTEQEEKDIQKYEATPCSKLNLADEKASLQQEDDQHLKFILRRQHSDLNFTSLSHERRFHNWRDSDRPKLSSMVSDFNSPERAKGGGSKFAQHNRMHSNIPQTEHRSSSINYSRPTQLIRSTSNVTHTFNRHQANSLYEPRNYRAMPPVDASNHLEKKRTSIDFEDSELIDSSPVQRFGALSGNASKELNSIEDDDFDLTKLLSITVLSDIKTIRQDSQFNTGRRNNNISNRPPVRSQDGPAPRQFTRSQTSTDFTYNGRRLNFEYNHPKQNHRFNQQPITLTQYHATPDLYSLNHSTSTFPRQNSSIDYSQNEANKQVSKSSTNKDRDASIIESFKAQVLARAMDPTLTPSKIATTDTDKHLNLKSNKSFEKQLASSANISSNSNPVDVRKQPPLDSAELSHVLSAQVDETMSLPIQSSESYQYAPKKSQIPRLISLHRGNILSKLDSKTEEARDTKTSPQSIFKPKN